jgi:hypothetical protein
MCFEEAAMGHCYHHALSSVKKWGGTAEEFLPLHQWFDQSKAITADFRHRALRHHAEGIFMLERFFGPTIVLSTGRVVPVRLIGEQHVREDLGFIPSFADWVRCIRPQVWMGRAQPIHRDVDPFVSGLPSQPAERVRGRKGCGDGTEGRESVSRPALHGETPHESLTAQDHPEPVAGHSLQQAHSFPSQCSPDQGRHFGRRFG